MLVSTGLEDLLVTRCKVLPILLSLSLTLSLPSRQNDPQQELRPVPSMHHAPTLQWPGLVRSQLSLFSLAPGHQRALHRKEETKPAVAHAPSSTPASPLCMAVQYQGKTYLYAALSRHSDRPPSRPLDAHAFRAERRPNLSTVHSPEHGTAPGTSRISPCCLVTTTLPANVLKHQQIPDQTHLLRPFQEATHARFASPRLSLRHRIAAHRHLDESRRRHPPWTESTIATPPQYKIPARG
jgi:hypothetical protein